MQIVLKAWSSNPDYSTGCDYAVVEGGEAFLKLALRRINVLCEQKIVDPSLNETYYWDSSAQYFSPWVNRPLQSGEAEEACVKFEESIEALEIDTCEVAVASSDFACTGQPGYRRRVRSDDRPRRGHRIQCSPETQRHLRNDRRNSEASD